MVGWSIHSTSSISPLDGDKHIILNATKYLTAYMCPVHHWFSLRIDWENVRKTHFDILKCQKCHISIRDLATVNECQKYFTIANNFSEVFCMHEEWLRETIILCKKSYINYCKYSDREWRCSVAFVNYTSVFWQKVHVHRYHPTGKWVPSLIYMGTLHRVHGHHTSGTGYHL